MAVGGDIVEITWNHPTLGTGVVYPKAAEDSTFDHGGFRGNDDANMIDGSGKTIRQLNRVRWSVETTCSWDMNSATEVEKFSALAGDPQEADWTFTHVNGVVKGGKGSPVGDIQGNGNAATFAIKISGGGKLKNIVGPTI
ncbi:MAG: hypothetical protein H7282_04970 [Cytophagaceae bacterium]|nr:hypothetical protein [Cytophagaceae bacterium]